MKNKLLIELQKIIDRYIEDNNYAEKLKQEISPLKIKYVLGELEKNKIKEYSSEDREIIKNIYFYFC
ncbi:hypothetical protein [Orenia marismortui]|uniref:Uncharacterized protein n=1 Tax=Orenia marismortui TaxID=46469 RepID=A0A4V3GYK6_9FIRM|nr:hypothetical protein [Orenia marismortui]TDX53271.1 hypothetical protein C7959_103124 [Orenia marismortui]